MVLAVHVGGEKQVGEAENREDDGPGAGEEGHGG